MLSVLRIDYQVLKDTGVRIKKFPCRPIFESLFCIFYKENMQFFDNAELLHS